MTVVAKHIALLSAANYAVLPGADIHIKLVAHAHPKPEIIL